MTYKTSRTLCILSLAVALVTLVFSCKKDEDPNIQSITFEREYFSYTPTSVTVSGVYSYDGRIDGIKMQVGKRNDLADARAFEADIDGNQFVILATGLQPGTEYHYCYEVDYGFSKPYKTETKTFATPADSPVVKTLELMALDSTTVRVKCEVVAEGGQEVTERGICWNTYGDPTLDDETMQHTSGGVGQYTLRVEGLALSTKYYFRAYAKNASGIGFGEVLEFETLAEAQLPEVSTVEISDVTSTSATCIGNVASNGGLELTECGVCWSLSANPSLSDSHAAASDATLGVFQVTITGLIPNKTYHARAYATNAKGTAYGTDLIFTTTEGLPVVTTSGITEITANSAKGRGEVTDQGASTVTERGICWGTSHNPTTSGTHGNSGTGAGGYTVSMTNLTPNATYYVRAYATNAQGTAYGAEMSFTALEGLPVVLTLDMTDITSTTAKGHGKVTDQGGSAITERGICWGTSPSPSASGSHASNGTGTGEYTVSLSNLTPGTRYYVRAYATNGQGTTYGEQKDFTTAATLPTVVTGAIDGTTVHGEVTNAGGAIVTERGICWSTSHNPTTAGTHGSSGTGTGSFSVELTDLAPGTTYYVRAYATNSAGTAYGSEKTLTTQATLPTVTTGEVSNITQTTAQGSGNVTNDGGATVMERGVCWSTSHNPTISGSHANSGTGTGGFTVNMTGLTANTHYYVRAYAKNSAGVSYGNEVDFTTTQNISAPTVTTSQVTNIQQTTATGGGNVTNSGGATVTERGICWSTSHNPTTSGSHANSGTGTGTFTVNMTGLTPNTTYYVRAYAINSVGTSYGSEVSFTTLQTQSYTISVSANPSNGGMVSGGGTYQHGQSCTVSATAATGYTFVRWTENGNQISTNANYTFTVNSNRALVANFDLNGGGTHEYVDLGLPSGLLWATCNVGADTPEEYGDYFAWGETQPKDTYNWSTYQYCMGSNNTLTKYCSNSDYGYNGFTDNLITLLPEDDAATTNWGSEWRMPTSEEWQELYQNTTHTWTTQNGVNGRLFTASNGNSLFLPAAGYLGEGSSINGDGIAGYFWSSSLYTSIPYDAWLLEFNSVNCGMDYFNGSRKYGQSVRAVRSASVNYTINVSVSPNNGGTVSGGGTYQQGQSCTVHATANSGYTFTNWTENGTVVSTNANYTFTVNGNRTLVANFNYNGGGAHEFVDLGLPSGTLWATCNVGASSPEDYGDYFAWGETQPKDYYNWATYQHCHNSGSKLTKYCNISSYGYNGFTDDLTTLLPEDDAAAANWGGNWRMPTKEEFEELYNNTTVTYTQQNGVNGRLFTASNGNNLFLPAAGRRSGPNFESDGIYVFSWSSSLDTNLPERSWFFEGTNYSYFNMWQGSRCEGCSVRPVRTDRRN